MAKRMSREGSCSFEGCGRSILSKRLCSGHYQQMTAGKELKELGGTSIPDEERFWRYVDKKGPTECWNWTGGVKGGGYGNFTLRGKSVHAHRVVMQWHLGDPLTGLYVDHQCRNPKCVNPKHLKVVTHAENMQNKDAYRTSKTGVRGVSPHASGRFVVNVSKGGGRNEYGGMYDTIEEAEKAAIDLRSRLFSNNVLDWDE